jgi:hypothetical protein
MTSLEVIMPGGSETAARRHVDLELEALGASEK